jgi:hypothetical protein
LVVRLVHPDLVDVSTHVFFLTVSARSRGGAFSTVVFVVDTVSSGERHLHVAPHGAVSRVFLVARFDLEDSALTLSSVVMNFRGYSIKLSCGGAVEAASLK